MVTASPERPPVVVVTGPTASGKTPLAIELALRFGGEIVNADSMQVFRFMDIGTAKPTPAERARVPHHLIDVVAPDVPYSAGRYARDARAAIAAIHARGALPLLAGGTGLYIRAALHGLIDGVGADEDLREQLEGEHERAAREGDPERLYRRLVQSDPAAAARIHPNDTRRIVRALEIAAETGRPSSNLRAAHGFEDSPYRVLHLALALERSELYARIDRRCHAMIDAGLLQEVRELAAAGYGPELRPMRAIGYRHIVPVMQGRDTLANALQAMQRDTRHFARRQLTWLRRVPDATWVDPGHAAAIAELVSSFLTADGARASASTSSRPAMASALPIVAIVGRPNVGKSTLFNRFAGHRRALVEDRPGITRDRIVEEVEVEGRRVLVVDTAGLDDEAEAGLPAAVQAQAWSAIRDADAILWVTDAQSGVLPDDVELARTLRKTAKPVTLAVNKVDVPAHADRVAEFYGLGFERTRGISAEHGRGAWDALEELVALLPPLEHEQPEAAPGIRVAVIGRPNVGKSSLVNRLLGEERVVVSDEPGTTRDAIDVVLERDGERYTLVDTAGLRRAGRRAESTERVSALMTVRALERADVALLLLDAAEGATDQDARVGRLTRDRGVAALVLANKWDRLRGAQLGEKVRADIAHALRFMADAPVLAVSAKTGAGLADLFERIRALHETARREIPTAELNRWLQDAVRRHEPAMAQRGSRKRPLKFFYATQTSTRPPTFMLFCSEPAAVQPAYQRFLENRLREAFGFEGTPVRIRLRARSAKAAAR